MKNNTRQSPVKRERTDFLILPDLKTRTDLIVYDWRAKEVTWHKRAFEAPFNMGVINLRASVLVCGGFVFNHNTTCSTRETREVTRQMQIKDLAQMLFARSFFSLALSRQEQMVYVIGGMRQFHNLNYTGTVELYQRKQNRWTELPSLQRARMCSGSLSTCDMLYSFFGQNQTSFREPTIEKLNLIKPQEGWTVVEFSQKEWRGVSWFSGTVLRRSGKVMIFGQDFYRPMVSDFIGSIDKEGLIQFEETSRQKFIYSYNRYKVKGDEIYCYDETFEDKAWAFNGAVWSEQDVARSCLLIED